MNDVYKDSPLGKIPKSWEVVKSNTVFELIHGYQFRDYDFTETGLPIVKIGQINRNGEIDMTGCSFFSSDRAKEFADKRIFNGDVLMALTGATLGKSCWVSGLENPVYQNYRVGKFIPHDEKILSKQFLYFLVGSSLALDQIMSKINSGAQGNVGKSDFEKLNIPLPPLPEQKKIAEILSTVDEKIEIIDQQIIETQELKKGLMQRLLTKGIGHAEFKDSPLGMIPMGWEVVKSSNVFELIHGYQFRDYDFTDEGLPIVKIGQINRNGEIDMNGCSYFSLSRASEFVEKRIFNGDVLMALTGATLGKSCWVDGLDNPVYQNYRVGKFVPHDENILSKQFLYFLVGSPLALDQIMSKINSGAQGNIGKADFEKLKIPLPPILEQHKIAGILSTVDNKLNILSEKKTHYQELKQGLMQQLLTGKIRVKV